MVHLCTNLDSHTQHTRTRNQELLLYAQGLVRDQRSHHRLRNRPSPDARPFLVEGKSDYHEVAVAELDVR